MNLFDHADLYSRGKPKAVFGALLKAEIVQWKQVVLQTKCGIRLKNDSPGTSPGSNFSDEPIGRLVEGGLRRWVNPEWSTSLSSAYRMRTWLKTISWPTMTTVLAYARSY